MAVSIVVGGQFGSEGKGKVAQHLTRARRAAAVVRVGGTNSGHTSLGAGDELRVLRQLPTAALEPDVLCVLGAGSYIDVGLLLAEIADVGLPAERLAIDPNAMLITAADREAERQSGLVERIGSTCSGTGAAVARRIARGSAEDLAQAAPELAPYLRPTRELMRDLVARGERVIVEGTQGFGLSLLHTPHFPKATSRDTTAAGALAEAGLSPLDVDEVVLVLRAFPIRVAGDSGPFGAPEIDWETVACEGGHEVPLAEHTSVTRRLRRIARFDPLLVRAAIAVNNPSLVVLNHVDYVDAEGRGGWLTARGRSFVDEVSASIGRGVDYVGLGPDLLVPGGDRHALVA
jgi:adenylosuccinate synthase